MSLSVNAKEFSPSFMVKAEQSSAPTIHDAEDKSRKSVSIEEPTKKLEKLKIKKTERKSFADVLATTSPPEEQSTAKAK